MPISAYDLDAASVVATIVKLQARIEARFPGSGLGKVCADLVEVGRHTDQQARALARPYLGMRFLFAVLVLAWIGGVWYGGTLIDWKAFWHQGDVFSFAQPLESFANLAILMVGAIWIVGKWEAGIKRRRAHRALYQLRSLAHVIDMHQLTKDPSVEFGDGSTTTASPVRLLSDFELSRYLDYCIEMLALIGKLAALYAGRTGDREIVTAVTEVENLTVDLGRMIWQKIMIIGQIEERNAATGD